MATECINVEFADLNAIARMKQIFVKCNTKKKNLKNMNQIKMKTHKTKAEILTIIFVIILMLFLTYFIAGYILRKTARDICNDKCEDFGALDSQTIPNGEWNTNDLCTCFYHNRTKSFRL